MRHEENYDIEIVDLSDSHTDIDVGVELSAVELLAVSGAARCSWTSGRPAKCDEWTGPGL